MKHKLLRALALTVAVVVFVGFGNSCDNTNYSKGVVTEGCSAYTHNLQTGKDECEY